MLDPAGSGFVQFILTTFLSAEADEQMVTLLGSVVIDEVQCITQAIRLMLLEGWDGARAHVWLQSQGMAH